MRNKVGREVVRPMAECIVSRIPRVGVAALAALALGSGLVPAADVVDYHHQDGIGSVRAITNQAGQVIERHDYVPFGDEWNPPPAAQPRGFAGKERDAETGLNYFGGRYYGARTGRFTTIDPVYTWKENLVDPQRWNRYAYVRNNPLRYVDPDGREIIVDPRASDRFKIDYRTARATESKVRELDQRPEKVVLKEGTCCSVDAYSDTIRWDSHTGTQTLTGGISPAQELGHEADHLLRRLTDPDGFHRDDRPGSDPQYGTREERRVITEHNEPRPDHNGNKVHVDDVLEKPKPLQQ